MNVKPAISVVTPTKNRLGLLCEAIDSVKQQSFGDWEHIVVDDGSNDGTVEEVMRRAQSDGRIRYFQRTGEQSGANVCRNLGIRESRADLVVFLDSDDLLAPNCLERRVAVMRRNLDLDFAVFRAAIFASSVGDLSRLYHLQNPGDDLLRFLSLDCPWQTSGPVWRHEFLETIGCFDETLLSMQDLEMHVRAIAAGGKYVCFQEVDHHIRGQDDGSRTSARHFTDALYIERSEKMPSILLETVTNSGLLTWTRKRALLGLCFGTAQSWVRFGRLQRALETWTQGCRSQCAPWHVYIVGLLMLCTIRTAGRDVDLSERFVNKWKGWMRFRQDPALVTHAPNALRNMEQS